MADIKILINVEHVGESAAPVTMSQEIRFSTSGGGVPINAEIRDAVDVAVNSFRKKLVGAPSETYVSADVKAKVDPRKKTRDDLRFLLNELKWHQSCIKGLQDQVAEIKDQEQS